MKDSIAEELKITEFDGLTPPERERDLDLALATFRILEVLLGAREEGRAF